MVQVMTKCFFCCLSCEVHDYGVWEQWATDSYATQGKASCIPLIKANRQQLPGISQETVNNHIASNNNNISNTLLGYWHATCGFRTHNPWQFSSCQQRFWTHLRSLVLLHSCAVKHTNLIVVDHSESACRFWSFHQTKYPTQSFRWHVCMRCCKFIFTNS